MSLLSLKQWSLDRWQSFVFVFVCIECFVCLCDKVWMKSHFFFKKTINLPNSFWVRLHSKSQVPIFIFVPWKHFSAQAHMGSAKLITQTHLILLSHISVGGIHLGRRKEKYLSTAERLVFYRFLLELIIKSIKCGSITKRLYLQTGMCRSVKRCSGNCSVVNKRNRFQLSVLFHILHLFLAPPSQSNDTPSCSLPLIYAITGKQSPVTY